MKKVLSFLKGIVGLVIAVVIFDLAIPYVYIIGVRVATIFNNAIICFIVFFAILEAVYYFLDRVCLFITVLLGNKGTIILSALILSGLAIDYNLRVFGANPNAPAYMNIVSWLVVASIVITNVFVALATYGKEEE